MHYLDLNLSTDPDLPRLEFSNKTILYIQISDGSVFSHCFKRERVNWNQNDEMHQSVDIFKKKIRQWQRTPYIVLPLELIDNRLEVISI